jgi:hypothetical protein
LLLMVLSSGMSRRSCSTSTASRVTRVAKQRRLEARFDILISIPGIGAVSAFIMLIDLLEVLLIVAFQQRRCQIFAAVEGSGAAFHRARRTATHADGMPP